MIHVSNATTFKIAPARVRAAAQAALDAERCGHLDVSVAIVSDEAIRVVHRDHMDEDTPTDVISFTLREESDPDPLLGEVVVSSDHARAEARARGLPPEEELLRYVIHGTLHLLGYEDDAPAKRRKMHARQEEVLAGVLAARGPGPAKKRPAPRTQRKAR